mmetsp:Transcript_50555/g.141581  ORF Transcript_50555/g.141581 Transcript_50555/m.141581 type:complete len:270 (+) Transcript_50555:361-1170(+)
MSQHFRVGRLERSRGELGITLHPNTYGLPVAHRNAIGVWHYLLDHRARESAGVCESDGPDARPRTIFGLQQVHNGWAAIGVCDDEDARRNRRLDVGRPKVSEVQVRALRTLYWFAAAVADVRVGHQNTPAQVLGPEHIIEHRPLRQAGVDAEAATPDARRASWCRAADKQEQWPTVVREAFTGVDCGGRRPRAATAWRQWPLSQAAERDQLRSRVGDHCGANSVIVLLAPPLESLLIVVPLPQHPIAAVAAFSSNKDVTQGRERFGGSG